MANILLTYHYSIIVNDFRFIVDDSIPVQMYEALESVMCDVIKIRLKIRIATRSGKGNQPLNIKTAIERQNYDVTHDTIQRFNCHLFLRFSIFVNSLLS